MNLLEINLSSFSDIIVGLSAALTAFFAWMGLSTWKRQHQGKIEYELARRLLRSVYNYRDAINSARNSSLYYPPVSETDEPNQSEEQRKFAAFRNAYQQCYDIVYEVRREIHPDVLESEALWGKEVRLIIDKMLQLEHKLKTTFEFYLNARNPSSSDSDKEVANIILRENKGVLDARDDGKDEFAKDFEKLLGEADDYLKKKLLK